MLDYRLDAETEALRKTVQEFAHEVIAPTLSIRASAGPAAGVPSGEPTKRIQRRKNP